MSTTGRLAVMLIVAALAAGCATDPSQGGGESQSAGAAAREETPLVQPPGDPRTRAKAHTDLAGAYYGIGNMGIALEEARVAIAADPMYAPAYNVQALVHMDLKDNAAAEASFQRGLKLAPNDADLNHNYGWFLCQTGRERQSIEYFQRALKDPLYATPAKPLHNAGICSLRMGDETAAEGYFQRAFQVDPSNAVAMFNLGALYLKRGQLDRAQFYSQRLLSTYEPTAQTLWLALKIARARGDGTGQASLAAQLRRRFPSSPEAGLLAGGKFDD